METKAPSVEVEQPVHILQAVPLDLHRSPSNSGSQQPQTPEVANKSAESVDSKKSSAETGTTPAKNRRKRKPVVTKKVPAETNMLEPDVDMANVDIESDIPTNFITLEKKPAAESDCETIDKIAQMVSNFTSKTPPVNSEAQPAQSKANDDERIEHQLAQLFAESKETTAEPIAVTEQDSIVVNSSSDSPAKEKKMKKAQEKLKKPRKKKAEIAAAKKQPASPLAKLNGKPGKKGRKPKEVTASSEPDTKLKSKENSGKSKVKAKPDVAPFVKVKKDGSFAIVNQTANGEDDTDKAVNKPKKGQNSDKNKAIRGLHVSTLSNKYDADKRDATWVCVFCKLGPHKHKLGDLFGPYIISSTSEDYALCLQDPASDVFRQGNKNKFGKSKLPPPTPEKPKKKRKLNDSSAAAGTSMGDGVAIDEVFTGMSKIDDINYEGKFI